MKLSHNLYLDVRRSIRSKREKSGRETSARRSTMEYLQGKGECGHGIIRGTAGMEPRPFNRLQFAYT